MEANIISIATGEAKPYFRKSKNEEFESAYKKDQFFDSIEVNALGLKGDFQVDKRFHGGEEKAIHIGSALHFQRFQDNSETPLDKLSFGCNIFIDSFDEKDIYVGDIYTIGEIEIQVTQPRQPCWKIGVIFDKEINKYIVRNHATGWYVKILKSGTIDSKNPMVLKQRLTNIPIYDMSVYLHKPPSDEKLIEEILSYDFVAQAYKDDILKALRR